MPPSLDRDPSCLVSLPSDSKLLTPLSQHQSSQVTMCLSGWWLKSFCISHTPFRDKDQMIISGSICSFCSCDGPGSSSSFTRQINYFVYFFFCIGATDTSMGWFSGLGAVPVTGIGVAAVPITGVGVAAVPVCLFSPSFP